MCANSVLIKSTPNLYIIFFNFVFLECDLVPADFVFLLDSSGSETEKGFKTQLAFISNFTANFEVGPNKAQFAAVTFSTGVHKDFYLNEHTDQASVLGAINKIQYRDGETYTDQGLNFVRNNVLQGIPINWLVYSSSTI